MQTMAIANVTLVIVAIHDKRSAARSSNGEIYLSTVPTDWVPISFTHRRCLAFKAKAEKPVSLMASDVPRIRCITSG